MNKLLKGGDLVIFGSLIFAGLIISITAVVYFARPQPNLEGENVVNEPVVNPILPTETEPPLEATNSGQEYIRLRRSRCVGNECDGFEAVIFPDGFVMYEGFGEIVMEGRYLYAVPNTSDIFKLVREIDFEQEQEESNSETEYSILYFNGNDTTEVRYSNLNSALKQIIEKSSAGRMADISGPTSNPDSDIYTYFTTFTVGMSRTVCFGFCPAYDVLIFGEHMIYFGNGYVNTRGYVISSIGTDDTQEVRDKLTEIEFDKLKDDYTSPVTDGSSVITFTNSKRVRNYIGLGPDELKELEQLIDRIAHDEVDIDCAENDRECLSWNNVSPVRH